MANRLISFQTLKMSCYYEEFNKCTRRGVLHCDSKHCPIWRRLKKPIKN